MQWACELHERGQQAKHWQGKANRKNRARDPETKGGSEKRLSRQGFATISYRNGSSHGGNSIKLHANQAKLSVQGQDVSGREVRSFLIHL